MKLLMTGLDYKLAEISVREKFAFTNDNVRRLTTSMRGVGVGGCVIISTCNRTEVYMSVDETETLNCTKIFCEAAGACYSDYAKYFVERVGDDAMRHLCRVAAGLDSQIMGDDQIITQVREAVELSRGINCTDGCIETLFKLAVAAAKVIKTNIPLRTAHKSSVPYKAVEMLKLSHRVRGSKVVVIGNGRMGRLVTELLISEGAVVTMTLREYKSGVAVVPNGADTIGYGNRYTAIDGADFVVSATSSPHHTLRYDDMARLTSLPRVILDLAMPRDVEPSINGLGVELFTVDEISDDYGGMSEQASREIEEIISAYIKKYYDWLKYKTGGRNEDIRSRTRTR